MKIEEELKADIKKSGFPLEMDVNYILRNKKWNVINEAYYLDQDENKARYIDIIATRLEQVEASKINRLNVTLVIECKRSIEKPWVFYMVPKGEIHKPDIGQIALMKNNSQPALSPPDYRLFWNSHYFSSGIDKVAIRGYVAFADGKNGLNTAINQSLKALIYSRNVGSKLLPKLPPKYQGIVVIYYPLVIFDGKMYECEKDGSDIRLSKATYIQYEIHYGISENISEETFLVDVVERDFLNDYLNLVDNEISLISAELKS
jgi:hypothetical protein